MLVDNASSESNSSLHTKCQSHVWHFFRLRKIMIYICPSIETSYSNAVYVDICSGFRLCSRGLLGRHPPYVTNRQMFTPLTLED